MNKFRIYLFLKNAGMLVQISSSTPYSQGVHVGGEGSRMITEWNMPEKPMEMETKVNQGHPQIQRKWIRVTLKYNLSFLLKETIPSSHLKTILPGNILAFLLVIQVRTIQFSGN